MEELKPVKSGKVKVDDVTLYYELYGQGDPLVLVAGTGISLAPWRVAQVPEFARHYQVLIYDHRGLGRSDKPDMHNTTRPFGLRVRTPPRISRIFRVCSSHEHDSPHSRGGDPAPANR